MRSRPALLRRVPLALIATLAACGGSAGPVDGKAAMAHVQRLVALGPRPAGSDALGRAADYICGQLEQLGLKPQRQEFTHETEQIKLRNLWVQIDGEDPNAGPILILGAHYDTKLADGNDGRHDIQFVGAIDGGGAPAVLLELARVLTTDPRHKPKVNVWLYFIDGEESIDWHWGEGHRALLGSKHFVRTVVPPVRDRVKAFVLLDLIGAKDIKIDRDLKSSKPLQDIFAKAAAAMGEQRRVYEFTSGITDDHESFINFGIPSVLLIDFEFRIPFHMRERWDPSRKHPRDDDFTKWWHTADDNLDQMSPAALAFTGNLVLQAWPDLEAWCTRR